MIDPELRSKRLPLHAFAVGVWTLWIDHVGGFRLLEGNQFSIGGVGGDDPADVAVRSNWRSRVALLERSGDEYWLTANGSSRQAVARDSPLPLDNEPGQPRLWLRKPSPLSHTAVLQLDSPHRFVDPVDGFILVDSMVLIGPDRSSHIRTPQAAELLVMLKRADDWFIREKNASPQLIVSGKAFQIGGLMMTFRREDAAASKEEKK